MKASDEHRNDILEVSFDSADYSNWYKVLELLTLNEEEAKDTIHELQTQMAAEEDDDREDEDEGEAAAPVKTVGSREKRSNQQKYIHQLVADHIQLRKDHQYVMNLGSKLSDEEQSALKNKPEIIRFVSYFKRRIKAMNNRKYYAFVNSETYYDNVYVITELVNLMIEDGIVSDNTDAPIDADDMIRFLMESLNILLLKEVRNLSEDKIKDVTNRILWIILYNRTINKYSAFDENAKLFTQLDNTLEIYDRFEQCIDPLLDEWFAADEEKRTEVRGYLEKLLDRTSKDVLIKQLETHYGAKPEIDIEHKRIILRDVKKSDVIKGADTDKKIKTAIDYIRKCGNPEISNRISSLILIKKPDAEDKEKQIVSVEISVKQYMKRKYIRKDGSFIENQ